MLFVAQNTFLQIGIQIPSINSSPLSRWNFRKANWGAFAELIDKTCTRIPPTSENVKRFNTLVLKLVKKQIPRGFRKQYIPYYLKNLSRPMNKTSLMSSLSHYTKAVGRDGKRWWKPLTSHIPAAMLGKQ